MTILKVGVCGTAHWAEIVHLPGFAAHPDTELIGLWGRDPESRGRLADRFGVQAFDSLEVMLERVDLVSFVVPPKVQQELALRAALAGKHLLLEKPLAAGLRAALSVDAAARRHGAAASCFLTRLFVPAVGSYIEKARSTQPHRASAVFRSGALLAGSPYAGSAWRQEAHGALWDAAPHSLSVLAQACGRLAGIAASSAGRGKVALRTEHAGGCVGTVEIDLCDPTTTLTECYAVEGDGGDLTLEGFAYDRGEAFGKAIDALIRLAAVGEHRPRQDLGLAIHLVAVLEAAAQSLAAGGAQVSVAAGWEGD